MLCMHARPAHHSYTTLRATVLPHPSAAAIAVAALVDANVAEQGPNHVQGPPPLPVRPLVVAPTVLPAAATPTAVLLEPAPANNANKKRKSMQLDLLVRLF